MAREYVPIYFDWLETTQDLSKEEKADLIDAVVAYASGKDYEGLLNGGTKIAFRFMKGIIDRNDKISDVRSKAATSKDEQKETNDSKQEQTPANENKPEQKETKSTIEEEKKEEEDKEKKKNAIMCAARFSEFWSEYPKKRSKPEAQKAFEKINPDRELLDRMITAIRKQNQTWDWQKDNGQYIPYPATWLHNRQWEDEVKPPAPSAPHPVKPVVAQQYEQRDYLGTQDEARQRMIEMMRGEGL